MFTRLLQNSNLAVKLYWPRRVRRSLEKALIGKRTRRIISERSALGPWDIARSCRQISFSCLRANSTEFYEPSDFYGNASTLKAYAGVEQNRSTGAVIEHGLRFDDGYWVMDVKNPQKKLITFSLARKACLEKVAKKKVFAVGPYLHYAEPFWNKSQLARQKRKLGKVLLAFPSHSTHFIKGNAGGASFLKELKELGKSFDSTLVCIYWKDYLAHTHTLYQKAGFKCVSAGHMFDPVFLPRLKSIIALADLTVSDKIGTNLGYCVYMGKPHYFMDSVRPEKKSDSLAEKELGEIERAFARLDDKISPRQMAIVDKYWGLSQIKSPNGLRRILLGEF